MSARRVPAIALLAALAACAPDFKKRSEIFDLRVIAIAAEPLEAGPGEQVTVTATEAQPDGAVVTERSWTFCPFSLGSVVGYACAVPATPACQPTLGTGSVITADPSALLLACAAELAAGGGAPPVGGGALPTSLEVLFRYTVRYALDGVPQEAREAVLRFPVYRDPVPWLPPYPLGQPWVRNRPPAFVDPDRPLTVRGRRLGTADPAASLQPGEEVELCAPLTGAQSYLGASGEIFQESLTVSFFSTAGKFDFDRASGPDFCVKLESKDLPSTPFDARLWAVGRDLRGGQVVAGPFVVTMN